MVTSYFELIEFSDFFVDNSLLIKELFDCNKTLIIITAPRGLGKSLNTDMIKMFVEMETDHRGRELMPKEETRRRIWFTTGFYRSPEDDDREHNFQSPLMIAQHAEFVENYQGQFPVIHLQFDEYVYHVDFESMCMFLNKAIASAYRQYHYLFEYMKKEDYDKLEPTRKAQVLAKQLAYEDVVDYLEIKEPVALNSLKNLCKMIYEYYGKKVVILVDDYDLNLMKAFDYKFTCGMRHYRPIIERQSLRYYARWFNISFTNNPYLEKAIVHGTLLFSKEKVFAEMNEDDYVAYDTFNNIYEEYYGFNRDIVDRLYKGAQFIETETLNDSLDWYKGYRLNRDSNLVVYNPYSISRFLEAEKIGNYWENDCFLLEGRTARQFFHLRSLEGFFKTFIEDGAEVEVDFTSADITHDEYYTALFFAESIDLPVQVGDANATIIFKLLSAWGYLTMAEGSAVDGKGSRLRFATKEAASLCARALDVALGTYPWVNTYRFFIGYPDRDHNRAPATGGLRPRIS